MKNGWVTRVSDIKRTCGARGLTLDHTSSSMATFGVRDNPHVHVSMHVHGTVRVSMSYKGQWWHYVEKHMNVADMVQRAAELVSEYRTASKPTAQLSKETP